MWSIMAASSQLNSYYYLHSTDKKTDLKTSSDLLKCACLMVAKPSSLILAGQQSRGSFQCTNTHMTLKQILGSLKPLFLPCKARYQYLLHKAGRIVPVTWWGEEWDPLFMLCLCFSSPCITMFYYVSSLNLLPNELYALPLRRLFVSTSLLIQNNIELYTALSVSVSSSSVWLLNSLFMTNLFHITATIDW